MNNDPDLTSDVSDFDLERSTDDAWAGFAERLAEVVSVMDAGASLSIGGIATETNVRPAFVTFRCAAGGLLTAEAAGNATLGQGFQLGPEQVATMRDLGWRPPQSDGPRADTEFWQEGDQEEPLPLVRQAVAALRTIYGVPHPAFLAPDQLAEILTPPPMAELPRGGPPPVRQDDLAIAVPRTRGELDALLGAELARRLGHTPVRDADGDLAIRVGSTMVFVRASADAQEVLVFAVVVHDVEGRSRAMEVISDLNTDARYVRFLLIRDRVFASLSVFAQPFVPAHLMQALRIVSVISDSIDNELAAKLRGRTTFADEGTDPDAP